MDADIGPYGDASRAAAIIRRQTDLHPQVAIVLGSGLGPLADALIDVVSIPYTEIPGFPVSTAPGHAGRLLLGHLGERPVAVLAGRAHLYEGYAPDQIVLPVRALSILGATYLIITNAAGGVNPDFHPGSLMLISDHINLTGQNPLVGPNDVRLGLRFPDMTAAYDPAIRALARRSALEVGVPLVEGVYLGLTGPSYETPAEIRMARVLGADAVGMSTVMEVVAARHAGMRVLGISVITNAAAGVTGEPLSETEVVETAERLRGPFTALVTAIVAALPPAR